MRPVGGGVQGGAGESHVGHVAHALVSCLRREQVRAAESVFIAGLFILAAGEMAVIASHRALAEQAQAFTQAAARIEKAVWAAGWDGGWFRRAYDNFGRPLGSQECEDGQIFIEPQGICVRGHLPASQPVGDDR